MTVDDQRLQLALEAGQLGTWDWDLRSGLLRWDQRTAGIFGLSLEEFDGRFETFAELVHPDDAEALTAALQQVIVTCGQLERDYRAVNPSTGEVRWVTVRGRVLCDEDGAPQAMLGVAQDRTESVTAGERLSRMLETIDEAFYSLDADWRFTYVNGRAEQLVHRTREELLGGNIWELFPDAVGSEFQARYEHVVATGQPTTFEANYGPLGWFEVRAYRDLTGLAVYFRDITQRVERERRQRRAHQAATRLLEGSASLSTQRDAAAIAARVCELGMATFSSSRASLWRVEGSTARLLAQKGGKPLAIGTQIGVDEVASLRDALRSQQPLFVPDARHLPSRAHRELARRKGMRSLALAPVQLGPGSEVLLVSLGWDHVTEPLDGEMLDILQRFAQQAALAVEQSLRREAEEQAAGLSTQLQSSLLPAPRLERADLEVASLYRAGERRLMLGGDFFDCMQLPDGSVTMIIGDVTGHGPEAAAIGATLRAAWRALALQRIPPGPKVQALDAVLRLERMTDEQMVSVCCTVVQPDLRTAVVASAGHPPPLLLHGDGASLLGVPSGLLLGTPIADQPPAVVRVGLPDRWGLLLYTDGLPEARCGDNRDGRLGLKAFADLVADVDPAAAAQPAAALRQVQERVRECASAPIDDDVALLLLRCAPQTPPVGSAPSSSAQQPAATDLIA